MSAFHDNALMGASGSQGYQISRSVRLRSSASAYFNRTPAGAGSQTTWTWSGWVKRGALGSNQSIISADRSASAEGSGNYFTSSDTLQVYAWNGSAFIYNYITTQVFRDPSAWYHIVITLDTTNATSTDRVRIYVNGSRITAFGTSTAPSQNATGYINATQVHALGRSNYNTSLYLDGYLTEINFIDGQALTPSSFGENDTVTGVWKPKKYTGTYGTNGFYLNFSDNSNNTAATIGKDYSGNGNNWTPNNISVTSGSTYDSMLDVPTPYADGGNGRGNYCVLSPIDTQSGVLSDGNMTVTTSASNYSPTRGTIAVSSGKWYWEVVIGSGTSTQIGICPTSEALTTAIGSTAGSYAYYSATGQKVNNNVYSTYGATYTTGDVIGHALDLDSGTLTFYKNNTSQGTAFTGLSGVFAPAVSDASTAGTNTITANFGQRPFTYTPPSGFKALNTQNLPDSAIKKGNQYFDVSLYTGNGTSQSIVNSGGFQPDLVWVKERSGTRDHRLVDAVRGAGKELYSSLTFAEATDASGLTSFNSNGYSIGSSVGYNANGVTQVGWQWKESATSGFDIVTFTGDGSSPKNIAHSLGVAPKMIIIKSRNNASGWNSYHASLGNTQQINLQSTAAASSSVDWWNNTSPTSSQFTIGANLNISGWTFVAYLFSEVAGFSRMGSFTGNGSSDGSFVYLGFRPRFILYKNVSFAGTSWAMLDSSRNTYNVENARLFADSSGAEDTSVSPMDFTSNGFKVRSTNDGVNRSGDTIIYAAFAENPFKLALAR